MEIKWHDGFCISVRSDGKETLISANREGLLSLADILTTLAAQDNGAHIHLDEFNSLEDGSAELLIEKNE